ncbi:MAG TPA: membrane protein insertion efficiency factor YidD [Acidimicrobiales bacterium]|nr:membrane protein insertion efficiency factor YidD [Acidimicrobiales bacterium]
MTAPTTTAAGPARRRSRRSLTAAALGAIIRFYQVVRGGRPSPCRYWPTCSNYALEALERHGAGRGTWLALRRVARCHPWGGRGVDPVPG